jgi:signal transduction histidine kinase
MDTTFESIDMNRLITEVVNAFEFQLKESGVTLHAGELPVCFGNELQITQVFSNLLNNALKYLDPARPGEITISGEERLVEDKPRRYVLYCVADNGIGISPEYHKKIFELFSRLYPDETDGEGLGLTIVNKIISRHHGKVWVESEVGEGSKFYILLPVLPAFAGAVPAESPEEPSGPIATSSN